MNDIKAASVFVSAIFEEKPIQWGLRGDPYLWEEMRKEFITLKEKGSDCEAGIYFFWRDTDKIRSAKHDRHEVAGFWRCN